MSEKDKLIEELSQLSNSYENKIIKFLDEYNLHGLIEATEEQLREFLEKERNNEGYRI